MQVQDALEDPTNSDPFGPEPEEIELPRTPTKAATPATAASASSYPTTPDDGFNTELNLPVLPGTRYTFQDPYVIRSTQSMDEFREICGQDDASQGSNLSVHSTGILEDAKKGLNSFQVSQDDDYFTSTLFGCSDLVPFNLFGDNEQRRITRSASVPAPSDSSIVSASRGYSHAERLRSDSQEDFHGIDFATGLSGHHGLNRTPKAGKNAGTPRRQVRLMSDHRGAGHVRVSNVHAVTSW